MEKLSEAFGPTASCPPTQELILALDEPGENEASGACRRHLQACAYCTAQVALFRSFESAQPAPAEREAVAAIVARLRKRSPAAAEPWWAKLWRPRFLAPAAIALAAASVLVISNLPPRPGSLETPVDTVMRSSQIAVIAPLGEMTQPPSRLEWQAQTGAAAYRVRLLEVDGAELWHASTAASSIEMPANVLSRIIPGKKLLWDVTALDSSGRALASSGARSFVVRK